MKAKQVFILFTTALWISGCGGSKSPEEQTTDNPDNNEQAEFIKPAIKPGNGGDLSSQNLAELTLTIDVNDEKQTIENFGASDAWSIQYVGQWQAAEEIAERLFSTDLDESNNPKGIGLSLWRFNIGAGSADQNNISDYWRRSETFLNADGTYDWSRQQGQQQFLQRAKSHGVDQFVAFANSPPIHLTANGKAFGDGGSTSNLPSTNVEAYTQYLVDIWRYFADEDGPNIHFDYLSPVNEPQWDWAQGNGQEGNPYTNSEIATLARSLSQAIKTNNIDTRIEIPEAAQLNFFYENRDQRGNQLDAFFNGTSTNTISDLEYVAQKIAGHSYFTTWPVSTLINTRKQLAQEMKAYPELRFWMSEYCVLEDNQEVAGTQDVKGINPALYTARVIHHDLTIASASSWQWWLAVSPYNYNDGLVYVNESESQGYQSSKTLWALGQYSRFIRPGMKRVGLFRNDQLSLESQAESLMASAYYDKQTGRAVLVLINYAHQSETISVNFLDTSQKDLQWIPYVTSASNDMTAYAAIDGESSVDVPARSIVTLVANTHVSSNEDYELTYFVNAGKDNAQPPLSNTLNSTADQAYSLDAASGVSWGYEDTPTWNQDDGEGIWDSLRTDEQNQPGQGLSYRFELPESGDYRVIVGLNDPWSKSNRTLDIRIDGEFVENDFRVSGQTIVSHDINHTDNELSVEILRSASNSGEDDDPLVSWIRVLKKQ